MILRLDKKHQSFCVWNATRVPGVEGNSGILPSISRLIRIIIREARRTVSALVRVDSRRVGQRPLKAAPFSCLEIYRRCLVRCRGTAMLRSPVVQGVGTASPLCIRLKRNYLESRPSSLVSLGFLSLSLSSFFVSSLLLLLALSSHLQLLHVCIIRAWCTEKQRERERIVSHQLPLRLSFSLSLYHRYRPHTFSFGLSVQKKRRRERRKKRRCAEEVWEKKLRVGTRGGG